MGLAYIHNDNLDLWRCNALELDEESVLMEIVKGFGRGGLQSGIV